MAHVLIDDLTEELIRDDDEGGTVRLSLDAESYEIDLTTASQAKLRELLTPYFKAGRGILTDAAPETSPAAGPAKPKASVVRNWAARRGVECPPRGRIPDHVLAQYEQDRAAPALPAAPEPEPEVKVAPQPEPAAPKPEPELAPPVVASTAAVREQVEALLEQGTRPAEAARLTGAALGDVRDWAREMGVLD